MSIEFDRTSEEYFRATVEQAHQIGDVVYGVAAHKPPETFAELVDIVAAQRDPGCVISDEIDAFMELIGTDPDPDRIARHMPCFNGRLAFIISEVE